MDKPDQREQKKPKDEREFVVEMPPSARRLIRRVDREKARQTKKQIRTVVRNGFEAQRPGIVPKKKAPKVKRKPSPEVRAERATRHRALVEKQHRIAQERRMGLRPK